MSRLIVSADHKNSTLGKLSFGTRSYRCALGRSGIRVDKREGDGSTPVGVFAFRRLLYRADRLNAPLTKLPQHKISQCDGWCDWPSDANYNRLVQLPYPVSAENLWREDNVYDLIFVIGHNDDPVVPNLGSAVFMHVATADYAPTAGCVALSQQDLLEIAAHLNSDSVLTINPPM